MDDFDNFVLVQAGGRSELCRLHHVFNVSNRLARIGSVYQIYSAEKKGSVLLVPQTRPYKAS
jgi:hypothetical protein